VLTRQAVYLRPKQCVSHRLGPFLSSLASTSRIVFVVARRVDMMAVVVWWLWLLTSAGLRWLS
jgi:hypothetical protein